MNCASVSFSGGKFSLTKDLYVNSGLIGPFDSTSDVNVFLEDSIGNLITPTGSTLVGNDLTITANIPNPSGVALQFPIPSHGVSSNTGDVGWRVQNGWFDYVPPIYPTAYAELDYTLGVNCFYRLKNALSVNSVSSTNRFVDLSGVQGWAALNNLNAATLDKLTGLMWTRSNFGNTNYSTTISNALSYSVTINGVVYSDWYTPSMYELVQFFGTISPNGAWNDPISGLTIYPFSASFWSSDRGAYGVPITSVYAADGHSFGNVVNLADQYGQIRVHKAYNLISA
jgi:hypothetical protein